MSPRAPRQPAQRRQVKVVAVQVGDQDEVDVGVVTRRRGGPPDPAQRPDPPRQDGVGEHHAEQLEAHVGRRHHLHGIVELVSKQLRTKDPEDIRDLEPDDVPGAQVVADISYGTWQSVFAGDPNVVGRETYLDGLKCTVIGVMPKGFQFPPGEQDPAQIWTALRLDPANPGNRG